MDVNASRHRGRIAEKAVKRLKQKQAQAELDYVMFGVKELENVLSFTYPGSEFEADGNSKHAIEIRMGGGEATVRQADGVMDGGRNTNQAQAEAVRGGHGGNLDTRERNVGAWSKESCDFERSEREMPRNHYGT